MKNSDQNSKLRLNKFISHNTNYSRREADKLIADGRVKLNKTTTKDFSTLVGTKDKVSIDDKDIKIKYDWSIIVYNKQKGELVTKKDPQGRKTIYDNLPKKFKNFIPIGRLDFASTGVLLLTDSPKMATILMTSNLERTYNIKIKGDITTQIIEAMQNGLEIKDSTKGAHRLSKISSMTFSPFFAYKILKSSPTYSKLRVVITEGQNRELRRFFAYFDKEVVDLNRVSFAEVELSYLPSGKSRYLTKQEYKAIKKIK